VRSLSQTFSRLLKRAWPAGTARLALPDLPGVAAALTAADLARRAPARFAMAVTPGQANLDRIYADLCALGRGSGVTPFFFPPHTESDTETAGIRIDAVRMLNDIPASTSDSCIVLATSIRALLQPVPDPKAIAALSIRLCVNSDYAFDSLLEKLSASGYDRVPDVEVPGQMAVRGGILDIWAPAAPMPWRAEFFGPTLESLRSFDPATQLSVSQVPEAWLPPCAEKALPTVNLADLLPPGGAVLWLDHDQTLAPPNDADADARTSWQNLAETVSSRSPWMQLFSGDPPPPQTPALPLDIAALPGLAELGADSAHHPELLSGARQRLLDSLEQHAADGETVMIFADTPGTCEMLAREIGEDSKIIIKKAALSGGFTMPGLTVAAQPDLYAIRKQSTRGAITTAAAARGGRLENAADLQPGDLVVHLDHGIGRFLGTNEIVVDGHRSEVFTIEYADSAKLHVPVSHAHLLSNYVGVAGHRVKLHRLGGRRWTREKTDAERAVSDLAASLLDTQARRQVVQGIAFNPEPQWLHEFEASFPYQETVDQERVIVEVKRDMASDRPMDRLICGDAGYGKTEIAMRAAFIAVMNGWQVAMLVPTTVLAEQHFETFCDRMSAYPIKIETLSRFHSVAKRKRVLADARNGHVDIVIGTHALLAPGVAFKNLGLLIIDEEQRFGVKHKERLKQMRHVVDVLTLSATPIPRTLYMSMTGARDMSLLQTPPRERVAVETKVARGTDHTIVSAIRQELSRNGQVYFLYNRVMTIELMRRRLVNLVPEARVEIAHGQMPSHALACVMRDFEAGVIDVLLCTTIVESGLDIPRANTILIDRADRFGIADLCQLRGRVGRSSQKGFAYLLLPEYGHVDDSARRRIAALQKHSGLGAGFNLALRDLEIRGAGNLLGAAQSGHIAAVGFGLYCQLLRRTIARLKGEKPPALIDVALTLDFIELSPGSADSATAASLPYDYIEEEAHRMVLHRRVAEASSSKELRSLRSELADRYGKPPAAVLRLLRLAELRVAAAAKHIGRIETRDNKIFIYRRRERAPLLTGNRLPKLRGKNADTKLTSIFTALKNF